MAPDIISVLINYSVNEGCVPSTWKHAVITPVPKVKPVTKIADLRPISVTPVFSRITERLVMSICYLSFQMKICEISLRTNCQAAQHLLWFL